MKNLFTPILLSTAMLSPAAWANAKNFEGFSAGMNLNTTESHLRATASTLLPVVAIIDEQKSDQSGFELSVQMHYGIAIGELFVLGLGGAVHSQNSADHPLRDASTNHLIKQKRSSELYIAPGFAITDKLLVYGKVAAVATTVGDKISFDQEGTGAGIGARYALTKNWMLQGELMQNHYDDYVYMKDANARITNKTATNLASVGLHYQF